MVNRGLHYIGGLGSAILGLVAFDFRGLEFGEILTILAIAVGILASVLPDIIEPPNGTHRQFFHSYSVLIILGVVGYTMFNSLIVSMNTTHFLLFFALLGYESHLILDLPNLPALT